MTHPKDIHVAAKAGAGDCGPAGELPGELAAFVAPLDWPGDKEEGTPDEAPDDGDGDWDEAGEPIVADGEIDMDGVGDASGDDDGDEAADDGDGGGDDDDDGDGDDDGDDGGWDETEEVGEGAGDVLGFLVFKDNTITLSFWPWLHFPGAPLMKKKGPVLSNSNTVFPSSNFLMGLLSLHLS